MVLRPLEPEDLPKLAEWRRDPLVIKNLTGWSLPRSLKQDESWLKQVYEDRENIRFAVDNKSDGRFIGIAGLYRLDWKNRSATIGIMLGEKDFWQGGYATDIGFTLMAYGFYELNLHRIWGEMLKENMASQNLCRVWGFSYDGSLREADYRRNEYHDLVIMSILKPEFDPQRGRGRNSQSEGSRNKGSNQH